MSRSETALVMSPRVRKFALALHLTVSIGWVGAAAAYLTLDVTTLTSQDVATLRASYLSMATIARSIIVPLAFASLFTGVVVSVGTKWGLFRHYWVLISFVVTVLATVVLLIEMRTINALAATAGDPGTSVTALRALPSTLVHSGGGTLVLLVVLVLNIYKPKGLTRYGWRKLQGAR